MRRTYRLRCGTLAGLLVSSALVACKAPADESHEGTSGATEAAPDVDPAAPGVDPQGAVELDLRLSSSDVDRSSCGLALDPDPGLMRAARRAAARWSAATGCDIRLESGGVRIVFVAQPRLADGTPKRAVTIRSSAGFAEKIEYRKSGFAEHTAEVLLTHELAHALGMSAHTATGIGAEPVMLDATIDTATLDAVCAVWRCAWFSPET